MAAGSEAVNHIRHPDARLSRDDVDDSPGDPDCPGRATIPSTVPDTGTGRSVWCIGSELPSSLGI